MWSFLQDQILSSYSEKSYIPSFAYHFLTAGVMLLYCLGGKQRVEFMV